MSDDVLGSIEGTATFKEVAVHREDGMVRVSGLYSDKDQTVYEAPMGSVYVGGLKLTIGDEDATIFTPRDDGWVWVEATDGELHITAEEPSD